MANKMYHENLGTSIASATSVKEALTLSGLDFEIIKQPMAYLKDVVDENGSIVGRQAIPVPYNFVTVRKDTGLPMGPVGKNYEVLQNEVAFDFLDPMMAGYDANYVSAGLFEDQKRSFILIQTEDRMILGDHYTNYILFINSYDGSTSVKAIMTPIRDACANTLTIDVKKALNTINIRHTSRMGGKLKIAKDIMADQVRYLDSLDEEARYYVSKKFSKIQFEDLINEMYKIDTDKDSPTIQLRKITKINQLKNAYDQPDLANFDNSAWKAIQAFADFESHAPVFRNTTGSDWNSMKSVVSGMPETRDFMKRLNEQLV